MACLCYPRARSERRARAASELAERRRRRWPGQGTSDRSSQRGWCRRRSWGASTLRCGGPSGTPSSRHSSRRGPGSPNRRPARSVCPGWPDVPRTRPEWGRLCRACRPGWWSERSWRASTRQSPTGLPWRRTAVVSTIWNWRQTVTQPERGNCYGKKKFNYQIHYQLFLCWVIGIINWSNEVYLDLKIHQKIFVV